MGRIKKWFCNRGGERTGPYTSRVIRHMVRTGDVLASDLLWKEGMTDWLPAERFPKLFKRVGRKHYSGPSGKLMGLAGLLLTLAIVASPFSELVRGLTGWMYVASLVACGLLSVGSIVAFALSLTGSDEQWLVVPAEGRLVRQAVTSNSEHLSSDEGADSEIHSNQVQEGATQRSMGDRNTHVRRTSDDRVQRKDKSPTGRLQAAVAALVVLAGCGLVTLYLSAEKPADGGPYSFLPVSGQVVGEGGKPLTGRPILLRFAPEDSGGPAAVVVPPGLAAVNPKTARFRAMIATARGQKVRQWRVAVLAPDQQALPAEFLPPVFSDPTTTPIMVERTEDDITIKLPAQ